ncbi:unnamed protein product [Lactuca virosa]|uniref:Phototropic-responsive NPH3 family protein n=1 Tax=Lactuca virosa TaxID=75947 RepID=A0AAU9NKH5_9ASTR|nr:unnamed protein product [Lactuca virosa]
MACMKLGTKPDIFRLEDHTWQCTSGLPSDVTIEIGETSFNLHKFPLISRSGLLAKLIGDNPDEDGPICSVHLNDIPGGCKAFELIAKFCYCIKLELTSHNVISLRCASDYLQMTDDYGEENLITQTETFLQQVFTTWSDTMDALESCEEVLSDAEDLNLISRCIDSLAIKACSGQNPYNPPPTATSPVNNITQTSIIWNGVPTSNKPHTFGDDWWYKDVSFLGLHLYKRLIQAMESQGMKAETIAGSLVGYAKKYIPLMNRQSSFNDASHSKPVSAPSAADQRALLEEIVELLPNRKRIVGTKFLIRLLRTALVLHVSPSCRENLEKRVGAQLDSAVLDDILIPNQGFNSVDTLYDIDCFQRILDYFMSMAMDTTSTQCSPCIIEEGLEDVPQSLTSLTSVANLVDSFLSDVAADVNMKLSKFQSLAGAVPDYARPQSDGIYRALDIFLKAHPWLTDCEREQICRLMNIQKLSLDASTHAAQNERLPLRVIVQVLFFEQLRLRTSIAGWFFVSENLENPQSQDQMNNNKNDGEVVRSQGIGEVRERVVELERECENMKYEMRKMVKKKRSWNFFCKRRRHRRM